MDDKPKFADLILSLAQSVYVLLGVVEDPFSKEKKIDLKQAKYTIDLIEVLKEKTEGNLLKDEQELLEEVLYDLRMKYLYALDKHKSE
ncbi:DUF1844 domain-containing protein [Hippea alviniae]|uniref:DUF1844 domain-containing protein n=1 Tax=Hippea alviniae TaxID=1279027 RepID=UPI0003B53F99|nr:DUF1844 domain-containing protein [Hippea alviniae]